MALPISGKAGEDAAEFELETQGFDAAAIADVAEQRSARLVAYKESEGALENAAAIIDIVERARVIADRIEFPDVKKVRMGDMFISVPKITDTNKRTVLDALFKHTHNRPHFDEFRGRIVDHEGTIIDDFYDGTAYLDTFNAVGLRELKLKEVIESVRAYALRHRQNDLRLRLDAMIPQWDGVVRMPHALVRMFECADTEMNRDFSMYFWLSLYCRCMSPGEEAPIVLTLIGVQNCGKSYFGKLLARMLTGDEESDSVQLDLGGSKENFLREITGQSVVASVGEMTGFNRGDLNKIKDFITRTHDKFSYKFEGVIHQPRQWITVMDSNRYEGLLRDDTGNRRFYPMFCGQLPDIAGKQQWRQDFVCDFTELRAELWQLLAEARAWLEVHGIDHYRNTVRRVSKQVFDFSLGEMAQDRGTIADDVFDTYLVPLLKEFDKKLVWKKKVGGHQHIGIIARDFKMFFEERLPRVRPNWRHLKTKMLALGGEEYLFTGGYGGYLFRAFSDVATFNERIGVKDYTDEEGETDSFGRSGSTGVDGKSAVNSAGF